MFMGPSGWRGGILILSGAMVWLAWRSVVMPRPVLPTRLRGLEEGGLVSGGAPGPGRGTRAKGVPWAERTVRDNASSEFEARRRRPSRGARVSDRSVWRELAMLYVGD